MSHSPQPVHSYIIHKLIQPYTHLSLEATNMSDCEHCYKNFYCSPVEHEAICTAGINHSKSLKRSSSTCSHSNRLSHVARGTCLNPKPTSLLNLRALGTRYGNHPATSSTLRKGEVHRNK